MRRSKSDPKKSVRHYRRVSQRRMTATLSDQNEDEEIQKLHQIIAASEDKISQNKKRSTSDDVEEEYNEAESSTEADSYYEKNGDDMIILQPKKKKAKCSKPKVELTPEEMKQAKQLHKNAVRKLKQLEQRKVQKQRRSELYTKLEQSALDPQQMELLESSKTLGTKKHTKKQQLQKLLKKERAGIELTEEEQSLLYRKSSTVDTPPIAVLPLHEMNPCEESGLSSRTPHKDINLVTNNGIEAGGIHGTELLSSNLICDEKPKDGALVEKMTLSEDQTGIQKPEVSSSFASMMMASLNTLQQKSQLDKPTADNEQNPQQPKESYSSAVYPAKKYVPEKTVSLKAPVNMGMAIPSARITLKRLSETKEVLNRPDGIQEIRSHLPVYGMEFEVMDAVRNHDVTIICGETGSGKSTQVPQFLYESGLTSPSGLDSDFRIAVTLPRRVAAVSTAKRVCYEMGKGNGTVIQGKKGRGNLVSYQTRFESAGFGDETRLTFMTDGILLQEIQSDLLLRQYSVIVLDEAHERNLNTDILIGLLSVALPLREKASKEPGSNLVPLKVIIMSATLRVEDFTRNDRLFNKSSKAVVKIPGRTFPVTIHHSKVTELDDYEDLAVTKVCKIHRKLPQGGILLFLTGKQEIVRVVNRLRKILNKDSKEFDSFKDPDNKVNTTNDELVRDLDDDEDDGDIFMENDDREESGSNHDEELVSEISDPVRDNSPKHATVLPLYSMLSTEDQAKIFQPVPEGHRLIVVATNIAETSITIPGITYVVDTGRQKCRNYHAGTGMASFDVMWISKAAADQRAGRAGRTGPGRCYRLFSSNMYTRHMDAFALPEVLSRPLEDVVLTMKSMKVSNVSHFPFPTPPDDSQIHSSLKILSALGCIRTDTAEEECDGIITPLGKAVSKLPLGVRYSKILLVAAQSGLLDYAILAVSVLSESNPFTMPSQKEELADDLDDDSLSSDSSEEKKKKHHHGSKMWAHSSGDVFAGMLAVGAYTFAGRNAGGSAERLACRKFCDANGLNFVVMGRIQRLRKQLAKLSKNRLSKADGVAARTGGISVSLKPPNKQQEILILQSIASGMLDHIAMLAPVGTFSGELPAGARCAYMGCTTGPNSPLYLDPNSSLFSRDFRNLPIWVCYDSLERKVLKDGSSISVMKRVSRLESQWIGVVAQGSSLLEISELLQSPVPEYDRKSDSIIGRARTKFGRHGWEVDPVKMEVAEAMRMKKVAGLFLPDDHFRWFIRYLLEGKVLLELKDFHKYLNDSPVIITRRAPLAKVELLVKAVAAKDIHTARSLKKYWAEVDEKFLFRELKDWIKKDSRAEAKKLWVDSVSWHIQVVKRESGTDIR